MMAAVESVAPPADQGSSSRALVVLEKGLALEPATTIDLVKAKCRVLTILQGAKAGASFVEERAKADPKGPYRRMLLTVYSDQGDLASAERVAADLVKETPDDAAAAAWQLRMLAGRSRRGLEQGATASRPRSSTTRSAALIYEYRSRFKADSDLHPARLRAGAPQEGRHRPGAGPDPGD